MIRFLLFVPLFFIIQACSFSSHDLDYDTLNQRFEYSSVTSFKNSITLHFNNDTNRFDIIKLDNVETVKFIKNDLDLFKNNKNHEFLIEKFPNKIYNFIIYLKDNNASEKIIFETMQTYLRFLTKDKTLR
ncbi:hypothetical protein OAJ70_00450 [Pelagibacteraceae bacterium]|nr:hypothetical protein [Pelagibacteraceae bacterium]